MFPYDPEEMKEYLALRFQPKFAVTERIFAAAEAALQEHNRHGYDAFDWDAEDKGNQFERYAGFRRGVSTRGWIHVKNMGFRESLMAAELISDAAELAEYLDVSYAKRYAHYLKQEEPWGMGYLWKPLDSGGGTYGRDPHIHWDAKHLHLAMEPALEVDDDYYQNALSMLPLLKDAYREAGAIKEEQRDKTLYIVVGAARSVGHEYIRALKDQPHSWATGIARNSKDKWTLEGEEWQRQNDSILLADVGSSIGDERFHQVLRNVIAGKIDSGPLRVVMLYTIGPFKFQNDASELLDDSVYRLNQGVFRDLTQRLEDILLERKHRQGGPVRMDVVGLSTLALERPDSNLFPGYCVTKLAMEESIRDFVEKSGREGIERSGLVLRTSTLHTPSEGDMRKYASADVRSTWITPKELVAATQQAIIDLPGECYQCLNVYKHNPEYTPAMHEQDVARKKWEHETGNILTDAVTANDGDRSLRELWSVARHRVKPADANIVIRG